MPKKAQMNANYRRNERLLEDGEIDVPGSGGVSQEYVDSADASTLADAKEYTDDEIAGIEIPEYTAGTGIAIDNGVISNTAPNQVPAIAAGDAGKVLQVNSGETGVEWASSSGSLPITIRSGTSNPTATTVGAVGDLYINTTTASVFVCRTANTQTNRYTWNYIVEAPSGNSIHIASYFAGIISENSYLKQVTSYLDMNDGGIYVGYIKNNNTNKIYGGIFVFTRGSHEHIYVISGCELTVSSGTVTGATLLTAFTDILTGASGYDLTFTGLNIYPSLL